MASPAEGDGLSLQSYAAQWPPNVVESVAVAAMTACSESTSSAASRGEQLQATAVERWLGALTRYFSLEKPARSSSEMKGKSQDVSAYAYEIANDLLLISLRLLPAPLPEDKPKAAESDGHPESVPKPPEPVYTATDRILLHNTLRALDIDLNQAHEAEKAVAQQLYFVMQSAQQEAENKQKEKKGSSNNKWNSSSATSLNNKKTAWKWAAAGAGFVVGGVALGVTGGLAAPLLAPLLVSASGGALAFLGTSGGIVLIGSLFGVAGGGLAGMRVKRRVEGIKMFSFDKVQVDTDLPDIPSLHATIVCNGIQTDMPTKPSQTKQSKVSKMWSKGYSKITKKAADKGSDAVADQGKSYAQDQLTSAMSSSAQSGAAGTGASASASAGGAATQAASGEGGAAWRKPFKKAYEEHFGMRDLFALKIDPDDFAALGTSLEHFTRDMLVNQGVTTVLKQTALAAFMSAVTLPAAVYSFSTKLLDSDWIRCLDKAKKAGPVLADVLCDRVQGQRPVILVGTSLGAVTILHALITLSERLPPEEMKDIVYSATLISLPVAPSKDTWRKARSTVAGPLVNAWSRNDWVLALLARASIHADMSTDAPAGLQPINVSGVTDVDLSDLLKGHMQLAKPEVISKVLHRTEVNERRTAPPAPDLPAEDEPVVIQGPTEEEIREAKEAQAAEEHEEELRRQADLERDLRS